MSRARRIHRHVRSLADSISGPADAVLLGRMLGWSLVLPVAKRVVPLPWLVRFVHGRRSAPGRSPEREAAIRSLSAWVFKTRRPGTRDNCLERGLVAYRYLVRAGADPTLIVGLAREAGADGHVWVTVDGAALHDTPETLARFEPVLAFAGDGRLILGEGADALRAFQGTPEGPEGERHADGAVDE